MFRIKTNSAVIWNAFMVLFAVLISFPAFALSTGTIRGSVIDGDEGLPIPGVTISLSSEILIGGTQVREANANGEFAFYELPPGNYRLSASKGGFQSITYDGIVVLSGRTATQTVEMPVNGSAEEIVVQGTRAAVDVENTTRGEVLTSEFLQRIPLGRSYQSAMGMVSGVGKSVGGNYSMAGAAYNENTYMIDGANVTDPVTGTFSLNFNFDAIQQIEVLLGGYMPEYGMSLGGVSNIATKSGSNNLEFNTSAFYVNGDWRPRKDARYTSDGFTLAQTDFDTSIRRLQISSVVSGPIVRDRAWFLLSYQYARSIQNQAGITTPRDYDGHYIFGKVTAQPNSQHRVTAFMTLDPSNIDNYSQSNPQILPEAQPRQAQGGYVTQGRWQWFLTPDSALDTQVVVQKSYLENGSVPCTHNKDLGYNLCKPTEREGTVDWETPGRSGFNGAYNTVSSGIFSFDDRFRYQASSKLSLLSLDDPFGGVHDIKMGVEAVQNVNSRTVGYSGNTLYYDWDSVAYDPNTRENYGWLEITGPIKYRTTTSNYSFFIQDAWKPISNVTIKGGFRYDDAVVRNDVNTPVITGKMFGPRLYVAWDPFGKQKTKISGGYGRFNDTGRMSTAGYVSRSGFGSKFYLGEVDSGGGQQGRDDEYKGFSNAQRFSNGAQLSQNFNTAYSNLRMPRADEVLLMGQHQIFPDVALGVNLTGKFTRNLYEQEEANYIYDQDGSAVIGTRFGDRNLKTGRLRTPTLARRDYYQGDIYVNKVLSNRWFTRVTYTNTRSIGSSPVALSGSFLNDPQSQYNYGRMTSDIRHVVKAYGSWDLPTDPWKQTFGFSFNYFSGVPLERLYYNNDSQLVSSNNGYLRMYNRHPFTRIGEMWFVNLKFSQELDVRQGKVVLDIEARNITNNRAPDESQVSSAFYTQNRLFVFGRQSPLRLQLGLRYVY